MAADGWYERLAVDGEPLWFEGIWAARVDGESDAPPLHAGSRRHRWALGMVVYVFRMSCPGHEPGLFLFVTR